VPQDIRSYSLEEAEALPVFMEPQHDQLVVAPVRFDESIIKLPETVGADSQLVYLVIAAGPGRMRADGERMPMDFEVGDLLHMSGRQLLTAFSFRGYVTYIVTCQSVAAKVDKEKLFDVVKRAKAGEFQPKKDEDKLEKKFGKGEDKPKVEIATS